MHAAERQAEVILSFLLCMPKKLVTTRRAIKSYNSHSQVLEPGGFSNPPDSDGHFLLCSFVVEGTYGSSEPMFLHN
eukprot:1158325-Pelagomonas_calceolata.AAC.15